MRDVAPIADRLWAKVVRGEGCWVWVGSTNGAGYGQLGRGRRGLGKVYAHRVSWEIHNGPIPEGLSVCHRCDNPPCVNPAHLFLGTQSVNMLDSFTKGRQPPRWNTKLTHAKVVEIRRRLARGDNQSAIAADFGVSRVTVCEINTGRAWETKSGIGAVIPKEAGS